MSRFIKTKRENIGLSPDAIVFRGEKKTDDVLLNIIDYDKDTLTECEITKLDEARVFEQNPNSVTWLNVDGLHDEALMEQIAAYFELDSLVIAGVMDTHARPKIQEYENCIYISVKMLKYHEPDNEVRSENLVLVVKGNILITFQERTGDVFEPVRERIRWNKKRIRSSSTDYLAFALVDVVFDHYKYIISRIGERIELLEEKLLKNFQDASLEEIKDLKMEVLYFHRSIFPCRELVAEFMKIDSEICDDEIYVHLKELRDNLNQCIETTENYREILSDQLNIYHTTVSSHLNDIMKFMTVFSAIFIPLSLIAGIYGTNFEHVPELHMRYGYYFMWVIMIAVAIVMTLVFKRKKWL